MRYKLLVASLLGVALFGCATYSYTPASGVEPARLKMPSARPPIVQVAPIDAPCPKANLDRNKSEIEIEPGKRMLVELGYSTLGLAYGRECIVTLSFVPLQGKEYSILYEATPRGCSAGITTMNADGQTIREPSSQQEPFKRCLY